MSASAHPDAVDLGAPHDAASGGAVVGAIGGAIGGPSGISGRSVLLVCDRLDVRGGVERFVCTLAAHLAGQGLRVGVASVATERASVAYALPDTVDVLSGPVPVPAFAGPRRWRLLRAQWHAREVLGDAIARFAPDVIVLNGVVIACAVLWRRPALTSRSIVCDHNHFGARSRWWQRLRAGLYPGLAAVVSLTHADRAKFAALNPRTYVIPNASALALPARPGGLIPVTQPSPGTAPIVLAVGRLVAQKGIDLLLRAWVAVRRAAPDARLHIVGDGPLQSELQALARTLRVDDSVVWLPPTDDIAAHYRTAAVFVLPSRYEGMPLSLLEAQALGVPAVAFDCPTGPADILRPATGVLVPPLDVPALAAALRRLLGDADLRARMGQAAVVRSRRAFAMEHHLRRWSDLVWQVVGQVTVDEAA